MPCRKVTMNDQPNNLGGIKCEKVAKFPAGSHNGIDLRSSVS